MQTACGKLGAFKATELINDRNDSVGLWEVVVMSAV